MKTYIENKNVLILEGTYIPKDVSNRFYIQALKEIETGKAILEKEKNINAPSWDAIKEQRDQLLKESDWIGATDAQPKPSKEAWLTYRQALRDITKTFSSPEAVVWPTKPA